MNTKARFQTRLREACKQYESLMDTLNQLQVCAESTPELHQFVKNLSVAIKETDHAWERVDDIDAYME